MLEVISCYPGLHALWLHRLAHFLWRHGPKFAARFLSHISRFFTNIEIHPGARIGSGSVVIKPVPPGSTVVGIPGRIVEDRHKPLVDLEHGKLPDPIAEAIRLVLMEQGKLEERLKRLEGLSGVASPK